MENIIAENEECLWLYDVNTDEYNELKNGKIAYKINSFTEFTSIEELELYEKYTNELS